MKYKLIAFDMDGTLLNSKKEITQKSLEAIKKAVSGGKLVCLSTGRSMAELTDYLNILTDVEYVIAISGALVFNARTGCVIFSRSMEKTVVTEIFNRVRSYDVMFHIHSDKSIVQTNQQREMKKYNMGIYQKMFDRITLKKENLEAFVKEEDFPVYKFNLYCQSEQQRNEIEKLLSDLPVTMAYAEHTSLECSALNISKGSGLIELCRQLKIDVKETIAAGDGDNDLEILKTAGLAVAMENAGKNVKAAADVIVASNDNDGCAEAIEKYLLK